MNNANNTPYTPYGITSYLYLIRLLAVIAIVLMSFTSLEHDAMRAVVAANEKSVGSLLLITELKQLLAAVSSIDIAFIEGAIKDIVTSLNKAENLLFVSGILTTLQMLIIKLSLMDVIKYAVVLCFVASFIGWFQRLSLKALLVLLMLSPGLTLYSNTLHFLADDMVKVIEGDLYTKLSHLTRELDKEKNTLLKKHQADLKKIDHSHSDFKWFHRLIADVSYDFDDVKDTVEGDYSTLVTVLRGGGKAILKETIGYFTKLFFLAFLLPVGYLYLLYAVVRYAFPKAPYAEVKLLDKLEQNVANNRHHLLADIKARNGIVSGVAHWLKHLFITPFTTKIKQESDKIQQDVQALKQELKQEIEQEIKHKAVAAEQAIENTVKHDIHQAINSTEQALTNEIRLIQQGVRHAIQARMNHLNQFLLQLNSNIKTEIKTEITQRIHTELLALNFAFNSAVESEADELKNEAKDEVKAKIETEYQHLLSNLEHAIQQHLLTANDDLHALQQQIEQSLQRQAQHVVNKAGQEMQDVKAEQARLIATVQTKFAALLQQSGTAFSHHLQALENKTEKLGLAAQGQAQDALANLLHKALNDAQTQLKEAETELLTKIGDHANALEKSLENSAVKD